MDWLHLVGVCCVSVFLLDCTMVIKPPSRPYQLDHGVFTSFGLRGPARKFVLLASFRRVMALKYSIPRHSMVIVYLPSWMS